jgi:hypothetical protein
MSRIALFVKHKTLPGKRDEVRRIWEKHMAPAVSANGGHTAYFYCFGDTDLVEFANVHRSEPRLKTSAHGATPQDRPAAPRGRSRTTSGRLPPNRVAQTQPAKTESALRNQLEACLAVQPS